RHPRSGRLLATASVLTLLALSTPIVAGALVRLLDDSPPIDLAVARTAQAIVIPGGGVRRNALEYGGDTLGRLTLERVRYGARLAKQTGLPVLVTGGSVLGNTVPEAVLMKEALENEYGASVRRINGAFACGRWRASCRAGSARVRRAAGGSLVQNGGPRRGPSADRHREWQY
ncbi:MAG: YdcF family protein, partial [Polyangiaceae bacterium]|nr:YdcF family protein [Polyangiaceae bacterium]